MNILAGALALFGLCLSTDWRFLPEIYFRVLLKNKHGDLYTKFDHAMLNWARGKREYHPEKELFTKILIFLSLLLSGILSLLS